MHQPKSRVVLFGHHDADASRVVRESAAAVGLTVDDADSPAAIAGRADAQPPVAILIPRDAEGADEACIAARSRPELSAIPILALAPERTEMAFLEAYQRGCNDVVGVEGRGLVRRLHLLAGNKPAPQERAPARAVIASADLRWRSLAAQALQHAGVEPIVVGNAADAIEEAKDARLVVSTDDLEPDGAVSAASDARAADIATPWVIVAPAKRIRSVRAAAALVKSCAVIDASAPAENAVFIANELASSGAAGARDARATARLLFGTTVAFRAAGRDHDDVGFTYNVSAGGCYVRTLAPLATGDEVWLELCPPRCDRRVRLAGRVAWRRLFGPSDNASAPPGFGVEVTCGLASDLARYRAGCESLLRAMERATNPPPRFGRSWIPSQLAAAVVR